MTPTPPLLITITSTEHGIYAWELHDQGFTASGCASTVQKCISAIAGTRLTIESHLEATTSFQPELPLQTTSLPSPFSCRTLTRFG